jgi:hypothetical protein
MKLTINEFFDLFDGKPTHPTINLVYKLILIDPSLPGSIVMMLIQQRGVRNLSAIIISSTVQLIDRFSHCYIRSELGIDENISVH